MNTKTQIRKHRLTFVVAGVILTALGVASATTPVASAYWDLLRQSGHVETAAAAETRSACANAYGKDSNGWYAG